MNVNFLVRALKRNIVKYAIYLNADSRNICYLCRGDFATQLIFFVMQLQIKVYSGVSALESNNRLFERIVDVHDDIQVPYSTLIQDLKFLFGNSCIVSFNVQ